MEIALLASSCAVRSASRSRIVQLELWPAIRFGLAPVEFRLVPARIDDEEHVALLHQLAGLKSHFLDVAGNARAHLDGFHRFGAAREFIPLHDFLLFNRRHCDGRWRRGVLSFCLLATRSEEDRRGERDRRQNCAQN